MQVLELSMFCYNVMIFLDFKVIQGFPQKNVYRTGEERKTFHLTEMFFKYCLFGKIPDALLSDLLLVYF